jgi:hypothetical protein
MPPDFKPLVRFFCSFALLYTLLISPWPESREIYSRCFCSFARAVFRESSGNRILRFDTVPANQRNRTLDARITIANRTQLDANGSGHAVMLDLDSRGIGWVPTAMLVALVLATPVSWPRRLQALFWGLLAVHAFILVSIEVYILNQSDASNGLNLVEFSPFWKTVVNGLEETLVTQLGASFIFPLFIWILTTFRAEDIRLFSAAASARLAKVSPVTQK